MPTWSRWILFLGKANSSKCHFTCSLPRSSCLRACSDLTLVATTAQLAHVKETRQDFVQKAKDAKGSGLGDEEGQELREIVGSLDLPKASLRYSSDAVLRLTTVLLAVASPRVASNLPSS
jgi:hypothetical protein